MITFEMSDEKRSYTVKVDREQVEITTDNFGFGSNTVTMTISSFDKIVNLVSKILMLDEN